MDMCMGTRHFFRFGRPFALFNLLAARLLACTIVLCVWGGISLLAQPYAATQAPGPVMETSATLNGMATPNGLPTQAWFEWGTNTSYGQVTSPVDVGEGVNVVRVSVPIVDLVPARIYWCRLVCSNAVGLVYGNDLPLITGGRVTAWGVASQITTPAKSFDSVSAISSGQDHALSIRSDGGVVAWGGNNFRQTNVPSGIGTAVGIAAGRDHSVALQEDGRVIAWGGNSYHQTNTPVGLSNVVSVAAGQYHSLALKSDGTVVVWGEFRSSQTNVPPDLTNVVSIAGCNTASLALKADGTVVAWGAGSVTNLPVGLDHVVAIAGGTVHGLALKREGTLIAWGAGSGTNVPAGLENVVAIAASLVLKKDGTVVEWGSLPPVPDGLSSVVMVSAGASHALALRGRTTEESRPFASTQSVRPVFSHAATLNGMATPNGAPTAAWFEWGTDASHGQITPQVDVGSSLNVVRVSAPISGLTPGGIYHCRLVASNEFGVTYGHETLFTTGLKVAVWGVSDGGNSRPPVLGGNVVAVAGGHGHSLTLDAGGNVHAWGSVYGNYGETNVPAGLGNVLAVAGGTLHSLALMQDGTVSAWGYFLWQRWPVGTVPSSLTNVVAIAGGDDHSLALRSDGTVTAWGSSYWGSAVTNVPAGLRNVVAITAGATHSLALKADGTVVAWGYASQSPAILQVPAAATQVVAVASSVWHSLALRKDGTVIGWGDNGFGQTRVPAGLSNVVAVATGQYHSLALKSDGTIVAWGSNSYGQTNPPTGLNAVAAISSGDNHCLALAPNTPPQPRSYTAVGPVNSDTIIVPPCSDPNGDALTFRVASLPLAGGLFQFTPDGRGDAITAAGSPITDVQGRVIFAPASDESGAPYTSFAVVANDGEFDSTPGMATVNIIGQPVMEPGSYGPNDAKTAFNVSFAGHSNATYSIWASVNLTNWSRLGSAIQPSPGLFQYTNTWVDIYGGTNWNGPVRFYQIRSP